MSKKISLTNHTNEELQTLAHDKREELRRLRFSSSGSKNRNVKAAKTLRREVARALTEVSARKNASK